MAGRLRPLRGKILRRGHTLAIEDAAAGAGCRHAAVAGYACRRPANMFAALDSATAAELEPKFAQSGHAVISNSSALRMHETFRWSSPRSTLAT